MKSPAADISVTEPLIGALLQEQYPEFTGRVRIVADGWDNVIARVGTEWCVRLPRRAEAVPLLNTESRWLPEIASRLPVRIPVPVCVGKPSLEYPWPWLISRWLPGEDLTGTPIAGRSRVASQLGKFIAALHEPVAGAPRNPFRGVPLRERDRATRAALSELRTPESQRATLLRAWQTALTFPPHDGAPVLLHGDLHPGNLLVTTKPSGDTCLTGVIDFGDLCAGDPASDLAVAWLAFDADARHAFREALAALYPAEDPVWHRARGWALTLGLAFRTRSDDRPAMAAIGEHSLSEILRAHRS